MTGDWNTKVRSQSTKVGNRKSRQVEDTKSWTQINNWTTNKNTNSNQLSGLL